VGGSGVFCGRYLKLIRLAGHHTQLVSYTVDIECSSPSFSEIFSNDLGKGKRYQTPDDIKALGSLVPGSSNLLKAACGYQADGADLQGL
jgi:hypothetical protein